MPVRGVALLEAVLALGGTVAVAALAGPQGGQRAADKATDANITKLTASMLAGSQFSHHPLDDQLASKLLERYLEALDGSRSLFLESDVRELDAVRPTLARATRVDGDTSVAYRIFARYLERLGQQAAYDAGLLRGPPFTFSGHDVFAFDRKKAPRPHDLAEARALWQEELRAEYLQETLDDDKTTPARIATTLTHRHERQLNTMKGYADEEVLEIYLDALTHVYDPHSDYLGRSELESFTISMDLSLFGIGASLRSKDGVCTIEELIPGSPAAQSGQLEPGDRIVGVAQGGAEAVDVTDLPLTRIVDLIRGPKGTTVTLTVLPPVGAPGARVSIRLVRAEVKLADQQAKARLVDLPGVHGRPLRLGVIDLPSFYTSGEPGGRGGAAADVARLLAKLQAEHVRGVVLDLRRNGGGSLDQAIRLTGLFIKRGPIVQTRDYKGTIQVDDDPDPSVQYDGPLVVLTSRFSASASEIAAGALQDYDRAVIVGDSSTFGKGTVQTVDPLAPLMRRAGLGFVYDPGALKITIQKFYRPSGTSTELRGVVSDIVLPSPSGVAGVSEASLTDPLPADTVPPAPFVQLSRVRRFLSALREGSAARVRDGNGWNDVRAAVAELEKSVAGGTISLNEDQRRGEAAKAKARDATLTREVRALAAARKTYVITVAGAGTPGLPAPMAPPPAPKSDAQEGATSTRHRRADETSPADELIADEALHILADYIPLLSPPSTEAGEGSTQAHQR